MIRINLLGTERKQAKKAIKKWLEEQRDRAAETGGTENNNG